MALLKDMLHWALRSTKNPQRRLDPQKNQDGTMMKDALLIEQFISAECVR